MISDVESTVATGQFDVRYKAYEHVYCVLEEIVELESKKLDAVER